MIFLLDVNALLAMGYTNHVHNARVNSWISQVEREYRPASVLFATCPITELGFVRVSSGKARYAPNVDAARADLQVLRTSLEMTFIPSDLPGEHIPAWVRKSSQTTDGYLLALARSHGARLATLDRFIPGSVYIPDEDPNPLMVREGPWRAEPAPS